MGTLERVADLADELDSPELRITSRFVAAVRYNFSGTGFEEESDFEDDFDKCFVQRWKRFLSRE